MKKLLFICLILMGCTKLPEQPPLPDYVCVECEDKADTCGTIQEMVFYMEIMRTSGIECKTIDQ